MVNIDEISVVQLAQLLEAKITQEIKTAKRTRDFKTYLDILHVAYVQSTALSENLKISERIAADGTDPNP